MNSEVYVFHEARFYRTPDGKVWTKSKADQFFWRRYFEEFDKVTVVARVFNTSQVSNDYILSSTNNVEYFSTGTFQSKLDFILQYPKLMIKLGKLNNKIKKDGACVIFRVPLSLSFAFPFLFSKFGVEVVGDPYDAFAIDKSGSKTFFLKWYLRLKMKLEALLASGGAYVTDYSLQKRYPLRKGAFHTSYSSIDFSKSNYWQETLKKQESDVFNIICVGSLEHLYKGPDICLQAITVLKNKGYIFHVQWIGDGRLRESFQKEACNMGLEDYISYPGFKELDDILKSLRKSHLFVLPSRQEGLPRAMIEAMTQSLCCIGTDVGGVKELIDPEFICDAGSSEQLANKIEYVLNNDAVRLLQSKKNYINSQRFESKRIQSKRNEFYSFLKKTNEQ